MINLEDTNETVFYIPFKEEQPANANPSEHSLPLNLSFDVPNGPELRWDAYRATWSRCLNCIQTSIHQLYEPVVAEVVEKVGLAYNDDDHNNFPLSALPHAEIPTVTVANSSSDTYLLSSVVSQLDLVAHLYPSDCVNLTATIKTIVTGFLSASNSASSLKFSAKTLAAYDLKVLVAWYLAQEPDSKPRNLILLLHDFEQFDPVVIQDVFYICSQQVPPLPLIFLLFLSSPQSPQSPHSYLHITYPRSTLKLLRIQSVVVPYGPRVLEDIVIKTFVDFSLNSDLDDPEIFLGPGVLEYLAEYASRFNPSVPALLNVLQLAYLKHFLTNPLTALVSLVPHSASTASTLNNICQDPASAHFRNLLVQRLTLHDGDQDNLSPDMDPSPSALKQSLRTAHTNLRTRAYAIRLAYLLLQGLHNFLVERGYKGLGTHWEASPTALTSTVAAMASASSTSSLKFPRLQNYINLLHLHSQSHAQSKQSAKDIVYARTLLRKLKPEELRAYLDVLIACLEGIPNELGNDMHTDHKVGDENGEDDQSKLGLSLAKVVRMLEGWRVQADEAYGAVEEQIIEDRLETFNVLNDNLAEWMYEYLRILTIPLENTPLWDVWYTGSAVFPSETLNPSIRASVLAGLLRPGDFVAPTGLTASTSSLRSQDKRSNGDIRWANDAHSRIVGTADQNKDLDIDSETDLNAQQSDSDDDELPLHTLPDTSILFHRYLESGKMINVYDWFESFHAVLGVQRREEVKAREEREMKKGEKKAKDKDIDISPRKKGKGRGKGKGKGKERATNLDGEKDEDINMDGQDNPGEKNNSSTDLGSEEQQLLVQARFIRALHELDFLGFIKHTRRKPDHVLRTVFEVGD